MQGERKPTSIGDARRRFFRRHQATPEILTYLTREPTRGRLLHFPCGGGRMTGLLQELGYDVTPADVYPKVYQRDEPKVIAANMTKPFPFKDGSFDYIVCQEGIEHIESPLTFTRECGRVLRVGGKLILSTPNVLHLSARLSYFLVGARTVRRGLIDEHLDLLDWSGDLVTHGHAWHWRYFLLRYILRLSGFKVYKPLSGKYSWFSILLSIPMYPVLRFAHWYAVRSVLEKRSRTHPELIDAARETYKEIVSHVLSRGVLWGKKVILVAERESPTFLESDPRFATKVSS